MKMIRKDDVVSLFERSSAPCVSIYMATHGNTPEVRQDRTRFKNLLHEAEKKLLRLGCSPLEASDMLAPAFSQLEMGFLWREVHEGVAVFVARDVFEYVTLPFSPESMVIVNEMFFVRPVLKMLASSIDYYLLALSLHSMRFFRGNASRLSQIQLQNQPTYIHHDFSLGTEPNVEAEVAQYCRETDACLWQVLNGESETPLIFCGTDDVFAQFKRVCRYRNLVKDSFIKASADSLGERQLHEKSWPLVQAKLAEKMDRQRLEVEAMFQQKNQRACDDIGESIVAAAQGRVERIAVPQLGTCWGVFDRKNLQVEVHEDHRDGDCDLIDLAALLTLKTSGSVFVLPAMENVPGNGKIASLLRY